MPLDHVTLCASDLATSARFYDAALGALGMARIVEVGDEEDDGPAEAVGYGDEVAVVWLVTGSVPTRGVHLAISARDRAAVEKFHAAALAAGGTSHSAPRRWPIFRRGEFNTIVRDPDGNLVEAVSGE